MRFIQRRSIASLARTGALAVLGASLTPVAAVPQEFEGTIRFRTVEVGSAVVQELAGDEEGRIDPAEVFEVPIEQLLGRAEAEPEPEGEGGEVDVQETTIQLKGSQMRVDVPDGYVLYDFEAGNFRMVQPSQRAYLEMTAEDLEAMRRQAEAMREEALENMPPDVRERMEEAEEAPPPDVRRLERTATINGVRAEAYQIEGQETVLRGWVTDEYSELAAAFQAFIKLAEQFAGPEESGSDPQMLLIDYGVPVRTQTLDPLSGDYEVTDLISVEEGTLSEDVFEVPEDFTRRSFPAQPGDG